MRETWSLLRGRRTLPRRPVRPLPTGCSAAVSLSRAALVRASVAATSRGRRRGGRRDRGGGTCRAWSRESQGRRGGRITRRSTSMVPWDGLAEASARAPAPGRPAPPARSPPSPAPHSPRPAPASPRPPAASATTGAPSGFPSFSTAGILGGMLGAAARGGSRTRTGGWCDRCARAARSGRRRWHIGGLEAVCGDRLAFRASNRVGTPRRGERCGCGMARRRRRQDVSTGHRPPPGRVIRRLNEVTIAPWRAGRERALTPTVCASSQRGGRAATAGWWVRRSCWPCWPSWDSAG